MHRTLLVFGAAGLLAVTSTLAQETPPPPPAQAAPPAATPAVAMVESIKIIIEDKAKTDGEIKFVFTPEGGAAKEIRVTVAKKMSNGDVAQDLAKELKVGLGADYEVDRYDRDKIKIEGKKHKKFALALSGMSANGLSVRLK